VQSSTMALMAAHGEIEPMPDCAIFADTGGGIHETEPREVYEWLDWLEKQLPFPVYRIHSGSLWDREMEMRTSGKTGKRYRRGAVPAFTKNADGTQGIVQRKCTQDHKVIPLTREAKRIAGAKRGEKTAVASSWIGISLDEVVRMKPSRDRAIKNRWPLIEARMRREDCITWMADHGYPEPPRSACVFCPYHSDHEWRRVKANPAEWAKAVQFESEMHRGCEEDETLIAKTFLHRSCVPLDEVDLSTAADHGQGDLWGNECEGMCGL